jgi:hypothetical protein
MKLIQTTFGKLKVGDWFRDRGVTEAPVMMVVDPAILTSSADAIAIRGELSGNAVKCYGPGSTVWVEGE